jgi:hypothetical protein
MIKGSKTLPRINTDRTIQGNAEIAGIGKERQFSPRRHRGTEKSGDRFSILAIPAILAMLGNFF